MIETLIKQVRDHLWLTIAAVGGLFFFIIFIDHVIPSVGEIMETHRTIQGHRRKIRQVDDWQANYDQLSSRKHDLTERIDQFIFNRRQDTHLSQILTFLSQCAKERRVYILRITPLEIEKAKRHVEVPIRLHLTARFHDLGRFINTIETSTPIIKIDRISIIAESMASHILEVDMTLCVYYLGQLKWKKNGS
jgi:Tfp pilus assembly protein PilO